MATAPSAPAADANPMPSASTRPDVNYLSIAGNVYSDPAQTGRTDFSDVDTTGIASVLKVSDESHDLGFKGLVVPGGNETAIDCDWSKNVSFAGDFAKGGVQPDNVLRAKGPYDGVKWVGKIWQYGKRNGIDVELGNWFDQAYGMGRNADLTGLDGHMNGDKITFAVGWVVPFSTKYNPDYHEYLVWESIKLKLYVLAKFAIRFILRIPKGTKGPSWF